jgi:hypothetical protein
MIHEALNKTDFCNSVTKTDSYVALLLYEDNQIQLPVRQNYEQTWVS